PAFAPGTASALTLNITLFRMVTRSSCRLGDRSSVIRRFTPATVFLTRLFVNWTFWTVHQAHPPLWLRGVNTMPNPCWSAWTQLFSNTLPSTTTSFAFFSSKRFLMRHVRPDAAPACVDVSFVQATGLKKWLPRTVILLGTRSAMLGSPPPTIMFSPEPSR